MRGKFQWDRTIYQSAARWLGRMRSVRERSRSLGGPDANAAITQDISVQRPGRRRGTDRALSRPGKTSSSRPADTKRAITAVRFTALGKCIISSGTHFPRAVRKPSRVHGLVCRRISDTGPKPERFLHADPGNLSIIAASKVPRRFRIGAHVNEQALDKAPSQDSWRQRSSLAMALSSASSRRATWSRWTRSVVRAKSTRRPFSIKARPSAADRWLFPPPGGPNSMMFAPFASHASPWLSAMT